MQECTIEMLVCGGRRHHEPNDGAVQPCIEGTPPSGGWIRRQRRREIERRRLGQRRVELIPCDIFFSETSTENCEERFETGEKGNRLEGSGNHSTFEGAVTKWAKTFRLPRTAAAVQHPKTRDRRAHHHKSSCHRIFLDF